MNVARLAGSVLLGAAMILGQAGSGFAQPGGAASEIASENMRIQSRIDSEAAALIEERAALTRVVGEREQLEARLQRIARHAELGAAGREFAMMVRSELRALPRPERVEAEAARRQPVLEAASDVSVRTESAGLALADLDTVVARRLTTDPMSADPAQRSLQEAAIRDGLTTQRQLLERLQALVRDRQLVLRDTGRAEAELLQRAEAARDDLTPQLFWSQSPPLPRLKADLGPAFDWVTSGPNWRVAFATLREAAARAPVFTGTSVFVALVLLVLRAPLRGGLAAMAARAAGDVSSRVNAAVKSIGVSLGLALPLPLLMWSVGKLLTSEAAVHPFALALGVSVEANARLLLVLLMSIWLLDPKGLAVGHFGWDEAAVNHAWRAVRRFTVLFVPLDVLGALNGLDNAPYANRETLGRLLFLAAMVVLTILVVRLFTRGSPLMHRLATSSPQSWTLRLYPGWYTILLAFPLGMLGLAAAGYITAAGHFFGRTTLTLLLLCVVGVLYGMTALWVQVRQFTLVHPSAARDDAHPGVAVAPSALKVDLAAMGEKTRSILHLTLTVLLMAGLWWVWKDALPALSALGERPIWSFAATDTQPASALTLGALFLSIGIAAVTWVAVRNVGALLDTLLLQRLALQSDANYAIKVVSRYALTAVGVLLASNTLGISWSSAQWLIAALGVGLGFGLQEIVANFVSGLIVLAERPVRIGDMVTVGNVTGTVSAIRARSTRVIDADHKEVIIPNKAFITEQVVNWTLQDTSSRLLLSLSAPHGSDIGQVQQLLLGVLRGNPDLLRDPPPSVYLVGVGPGSLDFEIAAYVDALDKRLRVRHELYVAGLLALRNAGIGADSKSGT